MAAEGAGGLDPSDYPILCETCLGENPFIRMTKQPHGKACKVCDRPFTIFRWRPGPKARYKKTELCGTCAKLKNVCQTCVLDLQYGLPVQVRDTALGDDQKSVMPKEDVNQAWALEQAERKLEMAGATASFGKVENPNELLKKLTRKDPYYQRNLPHICSFFAKGACNRGAACPYRHDMPSSGPMAQQNIKDRFYGNNDPVANKMLGALRDAPNSHSAEAVTPPDDKSITTLFCGGLDDKTSEAELRDKFYPYGELQSIHIAANAQNGRKFAFVQFYDRPSAEEAILRLHNKLVIRDRHIRIDWGKKSAPQSNVSFRDRPVSAPPGMKSNKPAASAHAADATASTAATAAAASTASSSSSAAAASTPIASATPAFDPIGLPSLSAILAPIAPPPGMAGARTTYASMNPNSHASKIKS